jgi:hypothetical protein
LATIVLLTTTPASAQKKKKGEDQTRSVQGVVTGPEDKPVHGAVVQLKNTKTLLIRSFLTQPDGSYYFHGLSPDIDYEITAHTEDLASGTRTLSAFDNRKEAIMNLRLNPIKK